MIPKLFAIYKTNSEEKIVYLSKFMAEFSTKNLFLSDLQQQITSTSNNDSNSK